MSSRSSLGDPRGLEKSNDHRGRSDEGSSRQRPSQGHEKEAQDSTGSSDLEFSGQLPDLCHQSRSF